MSKKSSRDLLDLYQRTSKHSSYQILPERVKALLPGDNIPVKSRHEKERFDYICSKLAFGNLDVADIGGNTGYFSFELLEQGVRRVTYYEGNREHYEFVTSAASHLELTDRLITKNEYVEFTDLTIPDVDCVLLLNVLHHVGDDYGDNSTKAEDVKKVTVSALETLATRTRYLIFQLGFNWKGNPRIPIFPTGTKAEMISLVSSVRAFEVLAIGIAVEKDGIVSYQDVNDDNIKRDDSLGEFLNRPLFILESKDYRQ